MIKNQCFNSKVTNYHFGLKKSTCNIKFMKENITNDKIKQEITL